MANAEAPRPTAAPGHELTHTSTVRGSSGPSSSSNTSEDGTGQASDRRFVAQRLIGTRGSPSPPPPPPTSPRAMSAHATLFPSGPGDAALAPRASTPPSLSTLPPPSPSSPSTSHPPPPPPSPPRPDPIYIPPSPAERRGYGLSTRERCAIRLERWRRGLDMLGEHCRAIGASSQAVPRSPSPPPSPLLPASPLPLLQPPVAPPAPPLQGSATYATSRSSTTATSSPPLSLGSRVVPRSPSPPLPPSPPALVSATHGRSPPPSPQQRRAPTRVPSPAPALPRGGDGSSASSLPAPGPPLAPTPPMLRRQPTAWFPPAGPAGTATAVSSPPALLRRRSSRDAASPPPQPLSPTMGGQQPQPLPPPGGSPPSPLADGSSPVGRTDGGGGGEGAPVAFVPPPAVTAFLRASAAGAPATTPGGQPWWWWETAAEAEAGANTNSLPGGGRPLSAATSLACSSPGDASSFPGAAGRAAIPGASLGAPSRPRTPPHGAGSAGAARAATPPQSALPGIRAVTPRTASPTPRAPVESGGAVPSAHGERPRSARFDAAQRTASPQTRIAASGSGRGSPVLSPRSSPASPRHTQQRLPRLPSRALARRSVFSAKQ